VSPRGLFGNVDSFLGLGVGWKVRFALEMIFFFCWGDNIFRVSDGNGEIHFLEIILGKNPSSICFSYECEVKPTMCFTR